MAVAHSTPVAGRRRAARRYRVPDTHDGSTHHSPRDRHATHAGPDVHAGYPDHGRRYYQRAQAI